MIPGHVSAGRALIGKRWRHRGRGPWWFDCVGLVGVALEAAGHDVEDCAWYPREADGEVLRAELRRRFGTPHAVPRVGDVGLFKGVDHPMHVGIFGNYFLGGLSLIHATNEQGIGPPGPRVLEVRYGGEWPRRFLEAYRPGAR